MPAQRTRRYEIGGAPPRRAPHGGVRSPRARGVRGRAAAGVLATLLAILILAPHALAAPGPQASWRSLRVGVLDVRSYARTTADLFDESPAARRAREAAGAWQRWLEGLVASRDLVHVVTSGAVRKQLDRGPAQREALALAATTFSLAVDRYQALDIDRALELLGRADALYRRYEGALVAPRALADVAFYRGLAWAERGQLDRAHVAFREMLALDPSRTFPRGYYPARAERAIEGALNDLVGQPDKARAALPMELLATAGRRAGVDVWVAAVVDGPPASPTLRVALIDVGSRGTVSAVTASLADAADARARVDRAISVWHTCALRAPHRTARGGARPRRRWRLDLGYNHSVFLKHKGTRSIFHSPGATVGLSWRAARHVHVFGRITHQVSLPDRNRDLLDDFATLRTAVGVGLVWGNATFEGFVDLGLEVGVALGDVATTTDVDCKHFGVDHPRCGRVDRLASPATWAGLRAAAGGRWFMVEGFYLFAMAGVSSYAFQSDAVAVLNFPFDAAAGLGTSF